MIFDTIKNNKNVIYSKKLHSEQCFYVETDANTIAKLVFNQKKLLDIFLFSNFKIEDAVTYLPYVKSILYKKFPEQVIYKYCIRASAIEKNWDVIPNLLKSIFLFNLEEIK